MHKNDSTLVKDFDTQFQDLKNRYVNGFVSASIQRFGLFISDIPGIRNRMKKKFDAFVPDLFLDDNQSLLKYGSDAKIIYIPGHSKGSIGILTCEHDFICGDIFRNYKTPVVTPIIENKNDIEISIQKILKYEINLVYPGHGDIFKITDMKFA